LLSLLTCCPIYLKGHDVVFKRYFKKRNTDIKVDNVRVYGKLIKGRLNNFKKMKQKNNEKSESLIDQVSISKSKIIELVKRWNLNLKDEELERLVSLKINTIEDAKVYADYLLYLHKKLEARHQVSTLNSRFLILPLTLGETIFLLVILIVGGFVFSS